MLTSIPKILHAFAPANEKDWHECWRPCYDSWFKTFDSREFQFIMWSDEACDKFVEKEFPEYLDFYNYLPLRIMKLDISRLLILYKFGGIYHDMDVFCYKNFYSYFLNHPSRFYIAESNKLTIEYVSNCLMASIPNNDLLLKFVEFSIKMFKACLEVDPNFILKLKNDPDPEVLYLTGPILIQNTLGLFCKNFKYYKNNKIDWYEKNNIGILPVNKFDSNVYTKHLGSNVWFKN